MKELPSSSDIDIMMGLVQLPANRGATIGIVYFLSTMVPFLSGGWGMAVGQIYISISFLKVYEISSAFFEGRSFLLGCDLCFWTSFSMFEAVTFLVLKVCCVQLTPSSPFPCFTACVVNFFKPEESILHCVKFVYKFCCWFDPPLCYFRGSFGVPWCSGPEKMHIVEYNKRNLYVLQCCVSGMFFFHTRSWI